MNYAMTYTDVERARYAPESFDPAYLEDQLAELADWRATFEYYETPNELVAYIDQLEANQKEDDSC